MPSSESNLYNLRKATRVLSTPEDYFQGQKWQNGGIPDNVLCFHREHQDHTLAGHEGISARSGKFDQHHRHVLIMPLYGEGAVGVEQVVLTLKENQALLIFPHQLHYYTDLPERFDWLYITFEVDDGQAPELNSLRNSPRMLNSRFLDCVNDFVSDYREAEEQKTAQGYAKAALSLNKLLREFTGCSAASYGEIKIPTVEENGARATIVHKIKSYLYSHLDENLSISDVAKDVGFSESYVRAAFKKRVGISLGQFILAVRLTHSARLLRTTPRRIAEIGRACGFDSQLSFSRAFKRSFRVSPRDYRKLDG